MADLHAAALAQDASVFDYDGVYDSIQVRIKHGSLCLHPSVHQHAGLRSWEVLPFVGTDSDDVLCQFNAALTGQHAFKLSFAH